MSHQLPTRIATWLLERVLPETHRELIVGDLIEEYTLRAQSTTPWIVSCWYWGQVCRSIPRMVWGSLSLVRWLQTLGVAMSAYVAAGALEFAGTVAISTILTPGTVPYTIISLVVGLTTMVIGGYFATWVRPEAGTVMAVIVLIVVAILLMTTSGSSPLWYGLAFLVFGPLAVFAGGTLCRGRDPGGVGRVA